MDLLQVQSWTHLARKCVLTESPLLDGDGVCGSGKQQGEGGASYSRPECSPLRRLHDTCMPDSRGSAARQAASTSRKIMDSWLMSQSEYARAGFIRWLGRPMDQNLPLCMWLFSSPSISGSSCHSGLEVWDIVVSESGLHTHGVSVPGARYSYKGRRTDIPPVIDMEPPQH